MIQFNKNRFTSVLKYTFESNRTFYLRNLFIGPLAIFGLMLLITLFQAYKENNVFWLDGMNQQFSIFMLAFVSFSMIACAFHPMVGKRCRIGYLTLPASNLEKYVAMVTITCLSVLSLALVTILTNFLMHSIIQTFFNTGETFFWIEIFRSVTRILSSEAAVNFIVFVVYLFLLIPAFVLWLNSKKYKNNIILSGICTMVLFFLLIIIGDALDFDNSTSEQGVQSIFFIVELGLAALCVWGSYKNFCKAQIIDRFNK